MPKIVPTLPGIEPSELPFSKVVEAGDLVFVAGQVGDAPGVAGPVPGGIAAEVRQMLENVGRLLRAVGLDYRDVVKSTVYLCNMDDFATMNGIYREFFPADPPTRATVGVARLASTYQCEIEVIASR